MIVVLSRQLTTATTVAFMKGEREYQGKWSINNRARMSFKSD